jgi:diguanylate cyclase (GGDEF)-like protein
MTMPDQPPVLGENPTGREFGGQPPNNSSIAALPTLDFVIEAIPVAMALTDNGLRLLRANQRFLDIAEPSRHPIFGQTIFEMCPAIFENHRDALEACLADGRSLVEPRVDTPGVDCGATSVRLEVTPWRRPSGAIGGASISLCDITELIAALDRSSATEERLNVAIQIAGLHVWELDYRTQTLTKAGAEDTFFSEPKTYEEISSNLYQAVDPRDRDMVRNAWRRHFRGGAPYRPEYRILRSDGKLVWAAGALKVISDERGQTVKLIGALQDITARKESEDKLDQQLTRALRDARVDELTGLANRKVFVEALRQRIARARRGDKNFAVICLDLDHFKDVNDTRGHPVGDELLTIAARRLKESTRETDTVARFGGDEFTIIVAGFIQLTDLAILAEKIIKVLSEPFIIQGQEIRIGASAGIEWFRPESSDAETLLAHADIALYQAKSEGRNAYRFFTDAMDQDVRARVALGFALREAITARQLSLRYQPQVALDSGLTTGAEALVRWRRPEESPLESELIIPLAEQMGLMVELGHWMLWEACRQARAWLDAGVQPIRMCVNLSAQQFRAPNVLQADIVAALAQTRLPAPLLELELTEAVFLQASREDGELLLRLAEIGVTISIDDFGMGHSSLAALRRARVGRIKIAGALVRRAETSSEEAAIVRATIGLARELGIAVIADGVETETQARLLIDWGCTLAQGDHFALPLQPEEFQDRVDLQ